MRPVPMSPPTSTLSSLRATRISTWLTHSSPRLARLSLLKLMLVLVLTVAPRPSLSATLRLRPRPRLRLRLRPRASLTLTAILTSIWATTGTLRPTTMCSLTSTLMQKSKTRTRPTSILDSTLTLSLRAFLKTTTHLTTINSLKRRASTFLLPLAVAMGTVDAVVDTRSRTRTAIPRLMLILMLRVRLDLSPTLALAPRSTSILTLTTTWSSPR
mmetsp:Transcript_16732/g.21141  ORF Transcript_16732/g.21141 Transcript_16732/m.21141 type:complete len:214 (+) Transcript_16732:119-760(+)